VDSIGMEQHHSHLLPDGSTFPPVTPDPPPPPGYVDPLADLDVPPDAEVVEAVEAVEGSEGSGATETFEQES
jgi:hypothetical protein